MTLGAAFAFARQSDDGELPEWTPRPEITPARSEKMIEKYTSPPVIMSVSAMVRLEKEGRITRTDCQSLDEIIREMEQRGY